MWSGINTLIFNYCILHVCVKLCTAVYLTDKPAVTCNVVDVSLYSLLPTIFLFLSLTHSLTHAPCFAINNSSFSVDFPLPHRKTNVLLQDKQRRERERVSKMMTHQKETTGCESWSLENYRKPSKYTATDTYHHLKGRKKWGGGMGEIERVVMGWMISPCLQGYPLQLYQRRADWQRRGEVAQGGLAYGGDGS